MILVTVTDDETGDVVQRLVSTDDLATLSGVQLAALVFPAPTENDITTISDFLDQYRSTPVGRRPT